MPDRHNTTGATGTAADGDLTGGSRPLPKGQVAAAVPEQALDLLESWFGVLCEGFATRSRRRAWFRGGPREDARLRDRHGDLPTAALAGDLTDWRQTPRGLLAWIITCDQLPRHLYRGTAQAFAFDAAALAAAEAGVAAGMDTVLGADERAFFYLPFVHAESASAQVVGIRFFNELCEALPANRRSRGEHWCASARQHQAIIARFGRFPHRNALLGRESTLEELAWLTEAPTFGQRSRRDAASANPHAMVNFGR